MKAVVAAFNQEKALVWAFSVITNLRMEHFESLKDKDGMLNFTEFKNFMAKRKSLPDKALARCTSTLSLRSEPPTYSKLSLAPPSYEDIAEEN